MRLACIEDDVTVLGLLCMDTDQDYYLRPVHANAQARTTLCNQREMVADQDKNNEAKKPPSHS